jgi:hypothetical protein
MRLSAAALFVLCGCGARVAGGPSGSSDADVHGPASDAASPKETGHAGGDHDTGGGPNDASPSDDAGPGCGAPSKPEYACAEAGDAGADGGVCHPYGEDAGPTYPLGCVVTLPTCDTSFGGAQTCNCDIFPGTNPGPEWICPI